MNKSIVIAIDTMGGDNSPEAQILGVDRFIKKNPDMDIYFLLYGDEESIKPILANLPLLQNKSEIIHTKDYIKPCDKPSVAIRNRNSSMRMAIKAVADGKANAILSAGNTGALMAISKITLKTLPSIDRPAIITSMPTIKDECVMLDLGANIECSADHLFQFAIMGNAFAKAVLEKEDPKVALLNIGSEELKGRDAIRLAAEMLKDENVPINFCGFVEGDDIIAGNSDVIVTDGFTGNIALKSIEGTAKAIKFFLKEAFLSSVISRIGALFSKNAIKSMAKKIDPRRHNGAMFIGLNGISVKSHGSADKIAFYNALKVTVNLVEYDINKRIISEMQDFIKHNESKDNALSTAKQQVNIK